MVEDTAAAWLSGKLVDPTVFCTLTNSERRLLQTLGLQRRAKDIGPTLGDLLRRDYERQLQSGGHER